jgi:hypothetical protein
MRNAELKTFPVASFPFPVACFPSPVFVSTGELGTGNMLFIYFMNSRHSEL